MSQDKYGMPYQKSFGVIQAMIGWLIKFFYDVPWGESVTKSQTPSCYTPCPSCLCLTEQSSQYHILPTPVWPPCVAWISKLKKSNVLEY